MRFAAFVVALFVAAQSSTPLPRFVRADGNGTGVCSEFDPCTIDRAVRNFNSGSFPPGTVVTVLEGEHMPAAQLVFNASGTVDKSVTWVGQGRVRITGLRFKPEAWTLVDGLRYTYSAPVSFGVGTVGQLSPTTWRSWIVDDRPYPGTTPAGRKFTLDVPPLYANRPTIAAVEAQSCTWTQASGLVYVHMCHDGAPIPEDDVRVGPYDAGSIAVNGDYLTFENISVDYTSGTGFKVNPTAVGTVLRKMRGVAAQYWLDGVNTLAEDLDVSHVIQQSPIPDRECNFDVNPDFGIGECFHASGNRRALLIGREGSSRSSNQVCRRCRITRSWNLARIDGPHTVEHGVFWGAPNHAIEMSGTGGTLVDTLVLNTQDSLFLKNNPIGAMRIEHNTFFGAVYLTTTNDGKGGTPVTSPVSFKHNMLKILVADRFVHDALSTGCNVYAGSGDVYRIINTNGIPAQDFATLAPLQAMGREIDSYQLPATIWTKGPAFRNFVDQEQPIFDFTDPLRHPEGKCGDDRAGVRY